MKTSGYFIYRGSGRIAISRSVPGRFRAGLKIFRELAPGSWFRTVDLNTYREKYLQQLSKLDPLATWKTLHDLAEGHEPILLCYETPPFDEQNFCHRRMVAE